MTDVSRLTEVQVAQIDRYLAGQCPPRERTLVEALLHDSPELARRVDAIARVFARRTPSAEERRESWAAVRRELIGVPTGPVLIPPLPPRRPRAFFRPSLVASVAVLLGLVAAGTLYIQRDHARSVALAPALLRDYTTANGQRANIVLPDGSQVMLNVASRLRVPADFGRGHRELFLEGEARFTVQHDPRVPFIVYAAGTVTKDLGTVFGVRAYPGSRSAEVVVLSGRVAVHASAVAVPNTTTLTAGQRVFVYPGGAMAVDAHADVDALLGWTDGHLSFEGVPLGDVLVQLGRWYNLEFVTTPELAQKRVTTDITSTTMSDAQLQALADVVHARARQVGRVVTFSPLPH
jgi:ferric-dicitrate binding protein FerR (iron transport regulator)